MPTIRFPTLLVLPATLWLAVSLGDEVVASLVRVE
jgi:hypothetical protein